ncbi:MAG: hypothetical protein N4A49_12985 [Marinifilaceae bacterium]|jgi:hypothetical protein|nr:hypothetical protein [Marinifilaceae bacterium]
MEAQEKKKDISKSNDNSNRFNIISLENHIAAITTGFRLGQIENKDLEFSKYIENYWNTKITELEKDYVIRELILKYSKSKGITIDPRLIDSANQIEPTFLDTPIDS